LANGLSMTRPSLLATRPPASRTALHPTTQRSKVHRSRAPRLAAGRTFFAKREAPTRAASFAVECRPYPIAVGNSDQEFATGSAFERQRLSPYDA